MRRITFTDLCHLTISVILILNINTQAHAALNLSVTPITGGSNSLRFGRIDSGGEINREVRVRITSTDGGQYQVYQRIVEPFINEQGQSLGYNALESYGLAGSNGAGTLYLQTPDRMSLSDQLIYTSGPQGESDSFIAVYSVKPENIGTSGNFFGKIYYTVRPAGSGRADNVILNVYLDAESRFNVEVEGSSSRDIIRIDSDEAKNEYIRVGIKGNAGQSISVYHEVEKPLENALFEAIDSNAVQIKASGSTKGELFARMPVDLERKPVLLYRSDEAEDQFIVHYEVNKSRMLTAAAGSYQGRVMLVVDSPAGRQEFPLNLELNVQPVFDLDVVLPAEGVRFDRLMPDSQPQLREVKVNVNSNLGKPYMVIQNVLAPLTNEKGAEIDSPKFSIRQELVNGAGKVQNNSFETVNVGDSTIFVSDGQGSPSAFKVLYRLEPYKSIEAGDYATSVKFSLSEL